MATITLRTSKGSALTIAEVDNNFSNLNTFKVELTGSTGSAILPIGTTAQRNASPASGYLRFNSETTQFEGYNGSAWSSVGGAALENDTATNTTYYPTFSTSTSGTALTLKVSSSKLTFNPSTGTLSATAFSGNGASVTNVAAATVANGVYTTGLYSNPAWITALDASKLIGTVSGDRGVSAGSTTSSFVEYNGTTKTDGQFDGGATAPTNTTRLNYDGYLYATRFYGDGSQLTSVVAASVSKTLTRGTYLTGSNFNGAADTTWTVDATSANTADKVVARDASGNFSAGAITASLTGNATTATTLQTARTINGVSFNGSSNITITSNTESTLTRGTYLTGSNFDGSAATTWAVDATSSNTVNKVAARDASGNFSANVITVTDLNSTSDRTLKDNIYPIKNPVDILQQIDGVSFTWKSSNIKSYGVVAQEIEQVLPELVTQDANGVLSVSYTPLIAFLIEAVKSQETRIKQLEAIINK